MFFLSTILLFAANAFGEVRPDAGSGQADVAATLLSRFEPGTLPPNTSVIAALAELSASGTTDHLPLLNSLVREERSLVQENARVAVQTIGTRHRMATRKTIVGPTGQEVTAWLARHEPVGPTGEALGRHEKAAVAYSALILGDSVGPYLKNWKEAGHTLEQDGQFGQAIRLYTTAMLEGNFEAIKEMDQFPFKTELLLLGIFTALPTEHPIRGPLMDWLVEYGSVSTVRIMADRAKRASALDRAVALEALAQMIRDGKLKPNAVDIARNRLERSTRDPHADVSAFARTTLNELILDD